MATIPQDEEARLRSERKAIDAIKEAHKHSQPVAEPERYRIPPSERFVPAERIAQLQSHRDELLLENCKLQRIIHAVLDGLDIRRENSSKGGEARMEAVRNRNAVWRDTAGEIRQKHPDWSASEVARKVKSALRCKESEQTIRKAI